MIRITPKSLIIEIPSPNQQPLALLSDLSNGINDLISVAAMAVSDAPGEALCNGLLQTTNLLKNMQVSAEQASALNHFLSEKEVKEFNNWAKGEIAAAGD